MNTPRIPTRLRRAGLALLLASTVAATAAAQYTGPGARNLVAHTVAEVLQQPTDDRPVILTGHLVQQTGDELYLFRDSTGEITVEIDDDEFPARQPISADQLVVIRGEVEARRMRSPRIDAEKVELATATPRGAATDPAAPAQQVAPTTPAAPAARPRGPTAHRPGGVRSDDERVKSPP